MKLRCCALFASLTLAGFAETIAPADGDAKLSALPLTLYPCFDVRDGDFATLFNRVARPDDALVVSLIDVSKLSYRVSNLGVTQGQVWIYVDRDVPLGQTYRENIAGARGLVYVPSHIPRMPTLRGVAQQVADGAGALGLSLAVGLDDRDTRSLSNISDIARSGEVLTICASSRLHDSPADYRAAIVKTIAAGREVNRRIKIELAFVAPIDPAFCDHQLGLAEATADLADRFAIYCEPSAESRANLERMLARFRPRAR